MLNPEDFRPKEDGKGDKYSWPLYKWLHKYRKSTFNSKYGTKYSNVYKTKSGDLFIGTAIDNRYYGKFLRTLCRAPTNLKMIAFYVPAEDMKDVTEEFWADYTIRGMCAIHPNYHDWEYVKNIRICNNCGIQQESMVVYEPKLVWISKYTIQEALYAGA